ncbi:unnamed protein product [Parnassius apollo]|uniref:(apollo) hypothetical protein n=1 Tax=Parnassius apollo TaxID=110799 RepID=A0A8S3Y4C3_PARAO|nr:unnamed protein product [Parnassius apollo]
MRAISSFETSCTMRVLILIAAYLVSATAAPSGAFFGSIVHNPYYTIPIPAAVPTISAGDLQAAAINAKVQFEQQAQAAADKARELAEQAIEKQNEGIIEANDLAKERAEESFWAAEEQKWQALDALKTAEAQIGGSIASRASDVALAAYSVPTAIQAQTGLSGHSVVATETKSITPEGANVEEQKAKAEGEAMGAVKSVQAESKPENTEKPVENVQADAAKMETSASVKTTEAVKKENPAAIFLAQTHTAPVVSNAFLAQHLLKQGIAPISYISGLQSYSPNLVPNLIPNYNSQLVNPVFFRAAW